MLKQSLEEFDFLGDSPRDTSFKHSNMKYSRVSCKYFSRDYSWNITRDLLRVSCRDSTRKSKSDYSKNYTRDSLAI